MRSVASASFTYQPCRSEQGALHQLVRDHFETFRAQAAHLRDGIRAVPVFGLPARSAGAVLVQGARVLSELWRSPHD